LSASAATTENAAFGSAVLGSTRLDDADYGARIDYVHFNPVKHGLVAAPAE
jgi:hypothetical protein